LKNTIKIALFFLLNLFINPVSFSQTPISGIINSYTHVDTVAANKRYVVVDDASQFFADDTVLIMQMKGAAPTTSMSNPINFGTVQADRMFNVGRYEFIIVYDVDYINNKITFNNPLAYTYNVSDSVQLIRVPRYINAEITGVLTCKPWDGSTGGVLAFFANDTLILNANIDVTSKGYLGAQPVSSSGVCGSSDTTIFHDYYFPESFDSAGYKGEGVAKYNSLFAKGLGRWANAGGGGNGRFAGGGGGGNKGIGGNGGGEDTLECGFVSPSINFLGGRNGFGFEMNYYNDSTALMGGGGGSGTQADTYTATRGGNGGGIVIVLSNYIRSNNYKVIADGESVTAVASASGGGGGAGGTIIIDAVTVDGTFTRSANGGKGGSTNNPNISGTGGGGGGGIVVYGKNYISPSNDYSLKGGTPGILTNIPGSVTYGATSGDDGVIYYNSGTFNKWIVVPLTGFMFNSILNNQDVCYADIPELLDGSTPKGGTGTYTFLWQQKTNSSVWASAVGTNNERDYQPPSLIDTTYYRRIVESGIYSDTSNIVKIIVQPPILGNNIFGTDTICIENQADTLTGTTVLSGGIGTGTYVYDWQYSNDISAWNSLTPVNDTVCWGGTIIDTTFYRRTVISGACYDTSNIIQIVGLPRIQNNILIPDQEKCYGQQPVEIIGETPVNGLGAGSYEFSWQKSLNGSSWTIASDSIRKDFAPDELFETTYYRRIVISGDCQDTSTYHKINVLPLISSNTITNGALIFTCDSTSPELLVGTNPSGGDGEYHYQWEKSLDLSSWEEISDDAFSRDYQSAELEEKSYFRRYVRSGIDSCCQDVSSPVTIDIHPLPVGVIHDIDTTICSNEAIELDFTITSGTYPYTLYYSDGFQSYTQNGINGTNTLINVNPVTGLTNSIFNYVIDSITDVNGCFATNIHGLSKILVYGWPESNAGSDNEICDTLIALKAVPTLGKGIWSYINGAGNAIFENDTVFNTTMHIDVAGNYTIQWKETNWKCSDSSIIDILMYRKTVNVNAGPDTTLYFVDEYQLNGSYDTLDLIRETTSLWNIISGPGTISNEQDTSAEISNLYGAYNTDIDVEWIIRKGECADIIDTVTITLESIFTPTGFSPNGDGINDYFILKGVDISTSESNELIIYNRWGTEVYRKKDYSNDAAWDGKNMSGNLLPEETYFYIFTITDNIEHRTHSKKGFVVLKGQGND